MKPEKRVILNYFERSGDVKEKRPEEKSESYIKLFQPLISIHDSPFLSPTHSLPQYWPLVQCRKLEFNFLSVCTDHSWMNLMRKREREKQ